MLRGKEHTSEFLHNIKESYRIERFNLDNLFSNISTFIYIYIYIYKYIKRHFPYKGLLLCDPGEGQGRG